MNRNEGFDINVTNYRVIYLWHGERHADARSYNGIKAASYRVNELRAQGFNAWAEPLRNA
jgi:hypothetical protein